MSAIYRIAMFVTVNYFTATILHQQRTDKIKGHNLQILLISPEFDKVII